MYIYIHIYIHIYICIYISMLPFQTENEPRRFPQSVYRLLIVQTEVCLLVRLLTKKQTEVIRLQTD
jgi:hypothetical protein